MFNPVYLLSPSTVKPELLNKKNPLGTLLWSLIFRFLQKLLVKKKKNSRKLLRKYLQKQNHKFKNFDFAKVAQLIN